MSQEATLEKVPTLEEVERLFTAWRQANQRPRRIPEDLWEAAVSLCRFHSVSRVCRTLGLGYHELKDRAHQLCAPEPQFVELSAPRPTSLLRVDCMDGNGRRMHIHCDGPLESFLPVLLRSFWEGE
jgi:hypothetical protein